MANEKRLIDVHALLLEIEEELAHESPFFTAEQNQMIDYGLRIAAKDIRHQPPVDAVEVVHGRWVNKTKVVHGMVDERFDCSNCGQVYWFACPDFNYCPNCGANMMDGGNEE